MTKDSRVTLPRHHSYRTRSNRIRVVRVPGGAYKAQYVAKKAKGPKCGDCGSRIQGVKALRPLQYMSTSKRSKSVNRAYGGSRCHNCVRTRIVRAFLIEEQKCVKNVLKNKK